MVRSSASRRIAGDVGDEDLAALGCQFIDQRSAELRTLLGVAGVAFAGFSARRLGRGVRIHDRLLAEQPGVDAGFSVAPDIDERADLRFQRRINLVTGVFDGFQLALDRLDARVRRLGLGAAVGEFPLKLVDQGVVLAPQCLDTRRLVLGEGAGRRVILVKLALEVVGDMRRCDRRDEREALGLRQFGRCSFKLGSGERLDQVDVDPVLVAFRGEQVALDAAACGDIGLATDETGLGVVRLDRAVEDSATNVVGIVAVVRRAHLREHAGLTVDVGGDGVSLRDA